MSRILSLSPAHAAEIESLARRLYPESYHLSEEEIAENLEGVEEEGCNFCLGIQDDDKRLVGYLLAWLDNTLIEGRIEDVVLVDDLALLPAARPHLVSLLRSLLRAMDEAGCSGSPIEGTVRKSLEQNFTAHPEVVESLGYQLVGSHEYTDESLEEVLVWIRFEAIEGRARQYDDEDEEEPDELEDLGDTARLELEDDLA
ncbi:hypothetical protein DYH09_14715 [bacterium CPR1]|nr:hypothetical protein [bacterium CPR1]